MRERFKSRQKSEQKSRRCVPTGLGTVSGSRRGRSGGRWAVLGAGQLLGLWTPGGRGPCALSSWGASHPHLQGSPVVSVGCVSPAPALRKRSPSLCSELGYTFLSVWRLGVNGFPASRGSTAVGACSGAPSPRGRQEDQVALCSVLWGTGKAPPAQQSAGGGCCCSKRHLVSIFMLICGSLQT